MKRYLRLFLIFFSMGSLPISVLGQVFHTEVYHEGVGLPANEVFDIAQDSRGRLIFATRNQVAIYDGVHWSQMEILGNDGYIERAPQRFFLDSHDRYWVFGIKFRLFYYDGYRWSQPRIGDTVFNTAYRIQDAAIIELHGSVNVIGFAGQVAYFFDEELGYRKITLSDSQGLFTPYSVTAVDTVFVLGTDRGVRVLSGSRWIQHPLQDIELPSGSIYAVASEILDEADTRRYWFVGSDWLATVENMEVTHVERIPRIIEEPLESIQRVSIVPDGFGGLFYGTPRMVYWYRAPGIVDSLTTEQGLHANGANCLFRDRENNLWVGNGKGITKIPGFRFFNYLNEQGLFSNDVSAIEPWTEGRIVLGHSGGLSIVYPNGTIDTMRITGGSSRYYSRVLDLDQDDSGRVWIAAERYGLNYLGRDSKLHHVDLSLGGVLVISVKSTPDGELVGTDSGLLLRSKEGDVRWLGQGKGSLYVRKISTSHLNPGRYYLAYPNWGFGILEGDDIHFYRNSRVSFYNNVYSTIETKNGDIFLASSAGLLQFNGATNVPHPLGGQMIEKQCFLLIGEGDSLWVGTDEGVYLWDSVNLKHYGLSEGLAGNETNRDAGYVGEMRRVWIGTTNGLSIYHPEYDIPLKPDFSPTVTAVWADSIQLNVGETVRLPRRKHSLRLQYEFISLRAENQVNFLQRLFDESGALVSEHMDKEREALYIGLEPGTYRFEVRGRVGDGPWSDPGVLESIVVPSPPLNDTTQTLIVILVTALVMVVVFYGHRIFPGLRDVVPPKRLIPKQGFDLLINTAGTVLFVDEGLARWLRIPSDKIVGRPLEELVEKEVRQPLFDSLRLQILERRQQEQYDAHMVTGQEGKQRAVRLRAQLVWENEHIIGLHVTVLPRG